MARFTFIFFPHFFQHFKWLQSHIKQSHEKEKPFKCDKCDMSFGTKAHLLSHAYYKHTEKNIYCDICGHKAKGRQDLRRHIEAKHEKLRNYACNVCEDTKFYSKWQLKMHTRGLYSDIIIFGYISFRQLLVVNVDKGQKF